MKDETLIQHLGEEIHDQGAVVPPIYQNSLFVFDKYSDLEAHFKDEMYEPDKHVYSRLSNPTLQAAEVKLAQLERVDQAMLMGSGMGAISAAIFSCIKPGDHLVCVDSCYGPTKRFLSEFIYEKMGVETTFIEGSDPQQWEDARRENTTLFYLESPSSIVFKLQDIESVTELAKKHEIRTILDNSYSSPYFQKPATMGVDLVVHSISKYVAGHSDIVGGLVAGSKELIGNIYKKEGQWLGARMAPFAGWLVLRGLRTLALRMEYAQQAGNQICEFLQNSSHVGEVLHVGDQDHAQKHLVNKQMTGTSSLLSFRGKNGSKEAVVKFAESLETFQLGVSWGGFESLCIPVMLGSNEETDWGLRVYAGLENIQDLMDDLEKHLPLLS